MLTSLLSETVPRPRQPQHILWACLCLSVAVCVLSLLYLLSQVFPWLGPIPLPWAAFACGIILLALLGWLVAQQERQWLWMDRSVEDYMQRMQDSAIILAEKENKLRAVVDHAIDGLITIDGEGLIESFNPACERIFGYKAEEVIGQNIKSLMPEPYHSAHDGYLRNYLTTGHAKIIGTTGREVSAKRKDGSVFPMDLAVSEFTIKGGRHFSGIVRDITERKEVERMKSSFISIVSHELRTPLTSIRGSIGLIRAGVAGALNPQLRDMLEIAHKNCERLILLINDILDIDKIESGEMRFDLKDESINPLVEQAIEANRAYGDKFDVQFVLTPLQQDAYVYVDADRFMQVLSNLLSNAAKFSHPGTQVEIGITREDGKIRITVRDYGIGICEKFHSRIFQKFAQADATSTRQKDGTGLGLHITQQLVHKMHGEVGFTSQEGKGSLFWLTLPDVTPHAATMPWDYLRDLGIPINLPNILNFSNNEDICRILIYALQGKAVVDTAFTTAEASNLLQSKSYRLVVMAPGNSESSAYGLLPAALASDADTHIILLSNAALPHPIDQRRVIRLAANTDEETLLQHVLAFCSPDRRAAHDSAA